MTQYGLRQSEYVTRFLAEIEPQTQEWESFVVRLGIFKLNDTKTAIGFGQVVLADKTPAPPENLPQFKNGQLRLIEKPLPFREFPTFIKELLNGGSFHSVDGDAVLGQVEQEPYNASYQDESYSSYKEADNEYRAKFLSIHGPKISKLFPHDFLGPIEKTLPGKGYGGWKELLAEFSPHSEFMPHNNFLLPIIAPIRIRLVQGEIYQGNFSVRIAASKRMDPKEVSVALLLTEPRKKDFKPLRQVVTLDPKGWREIEGELTYDLRYPTGGAMQVQPYISYRDAVVIKDEKIKHKLITDQEERELEQIQSEASGRRSLGIMDNSIAEGLARPPKTTTKPKGDTYETVPDTYTRIEFLGEGGSGRVFKAKDSAGKLVAVKLLEKSTKEKRKRFQNELTFGLRNAHKNIISVLAYGIMPDGVPFYVMPLYQRSLKQLMSGTIGHNQILSLFGSLLDGVEAAHLQKIIHRDLKPENILYDEEEVQLVVADFGIAHFEEDELYTLAGTKDGDVRLANFKYAAPEQKEKGVVVTARADIYALGLILHEMYTKVIPQGTDPLKVSDVVPEAAYLDRIIHKMIQQDPAKRYGTVGDVKKDIAHYGGIALAEQKLSEVTGRIMPGHQVDDPLILDPMKLLDVDYKNGKLIFILSRNMTAPWAEAFHAVSQYPGIYTHGRKPDDVQFNKNEGTLTAEEQETESLFGQFQAWLQTANSIYRERREAEYAKERMKVEEAFKREKEEEARRVRVLKNLRFQS